MNLFKKILICTGMFLVVVAITLGISYAITITSTESSTTNKISTGVLNGQIIETYTTPEVVMPGDNISDVIKVKNTGTVSSLVRLKVVKVWGSSRDVNNNLVVEPSDEDLSSSNIMLNVNSEKWVEIDGYYYYKGILDAGDVSASFIESFDVSSDTDDSYKNKTADIRVSMEMIQAAGDAIVSIWGLDYSDLNIGKPSDGGGLGDTLVTFISPDQKFDIDAGNVDLFKNFKELVPGIGRSQVITIKNSYTESQNMYLKATMASQSSESEELIDDIIKEYVIITVKDGDTVLYSGPIWGNLDGDSDTMKDYISLGYFASNATKNLVVTLSVDPDMNNDYQGLIANIDWSFKAEDVASELYGSLTVEDYYVTLSGDEILLHTDSTSYSGLIGDDYVIVPNEYDNYKLDEDRLPDNATGQYTLEDITVKYYYVLKEIEEDIDIIKVGPDVIESVTDEFEYGIVSAIAVDCPNGDATITIVDKLPYKLDVENSDIGDGIYNENDMTITWVYDVTVTDSRYDDVIALDAINLKYIDIDYSKPLINRAYVSFELDNGYKISDSAELETDLKIPSRVVVNHYDEKTGDLIETVVINGYVGDDYNTKALDSVLQDGYTVSKVVGKKNGKMQLDDVTISYYYAISSNPFTGDSIWFYFIFLGASIIIFVTVAIVSIKKGKKK